MIRTKNLLTIAALVALSTTTLGQGKYGATPEDSVKCRQSLSLLQEFAKQKDFKQAYTHWLDAFTTCPSASKNIYIYGTRIFRSRIKNAEGDAKKVLADSLMMLYDQRIAHFGQECYVKGRKGIDMQRFLRDNKEDIYNTLKESVDGCQNKTEAPVISAYYKSIYDMFKKEKVEKALLLTEYVRLKAIVDANLTKNCNQGNAKQDKKCDQYNKALGKMNEVFFRVAECPEIEDIAKKIVAENPGDVETCKSMLTVLDKKGCDGSDTYREVAECVHNDSPTHESAYSLGKIYAKKKSFAKALEYFKQAIELCVDCPEQEKYLEKAGQTASALGRVSEVNGFADKMLALNPNNGEAYILKGNALAARIGKCDGDVENWCAAWRAYDIFAKAKSLDSSVAAKAGKRMGSARARFPEKQKMFFQNLTEGQSVSCGCVGGSTTARAK